MSNGLFFSCIQTARVCFYWQTTFTICLCSQYVLHLTSVGLPGCDGGGVLWWCGRCALPLPLLYPGSLCLHCHAVCHSQGMETNCLQVSLFSACLPASLPAGAPSFPPPAPISMQHHILYYISQLMHVCEYFWLLYKSRYFGTKWVQNVGLQITSSKWPNLNSLFAYVLLCVPVYLKHQVKAPYSIFDM